MRYTNYFFFKNGKAKFENAVRQHTKQSSVHLELRSLSYAIHFTSMT